MTTNFTLYPAKFFFIFIAAFTAYSPNAQTNYAVALNGTNQCVSMGAPIATGSSYTKEAWVYATNVSGNRNIISSQNSPFWISGGTLYAGQAGNYTRVSAPGTFPVNRWVHVAVTYDVVTTTMSLYQDGVQVGTNSSVPGYTSENEFIGSHAGGASYFAGRIDEVRIWNIALTSSQIKEKAYAWPAANASGLVTYYKFDEGTGVTAVNATGGANGILQNGSTWVQSPVQFSLNAISVDGTNDFITVPDHPSLDISTAITLEGWVYATKSTGIQNVISKSSNAINTGYIFPRTDNGWTDVVIYLHIAGAWRRVSANYPSRNVWHHLAATYDGAMIRLYIDGALATSSAQTGNITMNANPLTIGNQPGYTEYFGGSADELRIWNVARTQAQIQADMYKEINPAIQTGLVSYYNFNQGISSGNNAGLLPVFDQKGSNNGTITNLALSGVSSNLVAQYGMMAVLPLKWQSFMVKKQADNISLEWTTANEKNNTGFVVHHSSNGRNWTNLSTVPSSGNNNIIQHYHYLHRAAPAGMNFYQIQQTDTDGRSSLSEIKSIHVGKSEKDFEVAGNISGPTQLRLNRRVEVQLYDTGGKRIWHKRLGPGTATISGVRSGMYLLHAGSQTERIFVR